MARLRHDVAILPRGWRHLVPRLPICVSGPNRILATMKLCERICGIILRNHYAKRAAKCAICL